MRALKTYIKKGAFFKAVVEDGSDIIFIINYEGEIQYVNSSVRETLGYLPKSLIGKNFFHYISPPTLISFKETFRKIKKKVYQESIEFQFLCKNGTYKFLEFNSINLKQKEKIEGFILDCRDITERKRDAEELQRAQKAKEQFLANISHEIRTPINGIAGMATLLSQHPTEAEQKIYLNAITSAADNLKVIINDILDLASIESGKLKFEKIGFKLNYVLQSNFSTFNHLAREKNIQLTLVLEPEVDQVFLGDPVRLNQILTNLISNAIKFTHAGMVSIRCSLSKQEKKKYYIKFDVTDTGIGIPSDKLTTIFESFSQADASVTRKYGGTGLGLTIVKQLIGLQGGTISVRSKIGNGSTFTFILPYVKGDIKALNPIIFNHGNAAVKSFNGLKVLLVEDNNINQLYSNSILKTWGCFVSIAENGLEAVEKVKDQSFDIILMDIQMPIMDGFEATKIIRSLSKPKNLLPIIALTANATQKDKEKCMEEGMDECIAKPFTPEDLYKVIVRFSPLQNTKHDPLKQRVDSTINLSYLKNISNHDEDFVTEMVATMLETLPQIITNIRAHTKQSDWQEVGRAVHKIKPSITLLGLHQTKEMANAIEANAMLQKPSKDFKDTIEVFCKSMEKSLEMLRENKS